MLCRCCGEDFATAWKVYCDRCYRALKYGTGVKPLAIAGSVYLKRRCVCGGKLLLLSDGWCRCQSCKALWRSGLGSEVS